MTKLKVRTPAELITAVPYLIGFHPSDSLVVAAVKESRLAFAARIDLPEAGVADTEARAPVLHLATVVAEQEPEGVTIIGYGDGERVTPSVQHLARALTGAGVRILDEFRVADGRFWSYLCTKPACCPAEGKPCDPPDSVLATEATFAGAVALANRGVLEERLAAATGDERQAMDAADGRALSHFRELRGRGPAKHDVELVRAGRAAIRHAERTARAGERLTDDEVAWLGYLMTSVRVRDYAWIRSGTADWEISLWSDVVRRVNPLRVPAPASLLSFVAWRAGMGALATIAVERALDADDTYSMALTMISTLHAAVPPSALAGWPKRLRRLEGGNHSGGKTGRRETRVKHRPDDGSAARKARYRSRRRV
ncbi:DUF4192 domain-containing protein [Nucisporomicrobium flavum]|uniref:DUF4192 domain-containing protein n=1 Tax=Nucisporomicrobium flavum TaxID=2785915 RepID=UPI0018F6E802|nr:DUF4192 domain-containing protein [Nucisporomicrobium flavum]